MTSTRTVKAPRLTRVSPQGHFVIAALRALPQSVRQAVFQELVTDVLLRTELEAALAAGRPNRESPKADSPLPKLVDVEFMHPVRSAKALASSAAEKLAAASYPYVVNASAKLVAFSGWMAHAYVKHATATPAQLAAGTQKRVATKTSGMPVEGQSSRFKVQS